MMRYARTILGYHGCDTLVAEEVLAGRTPLRASENAYDWLGRGIHEATARVDAMLAPQTPGRRGRLAARRG